MNTLFRNPSSGRFKEAFLLFLALAIGISAYFSIVLNRTGALPSNLEAHIGILVVFTLVTHLLVRHFAPYADPVMLPTVIALNGIGLAMLYRLDLGYKLYPQMHLYLTNYRQLSYTFIGIVLMASTLIIFRDYKTVKNYTYTAMIGGIFLLLSPLIPFLGQEINGARIWINLGFQVQPAELAKILLTIFFAGYLVSRRDALIKGGKNIFGVVLPRIRDLGPLFIIFIFSIFILVFEKDLGTSLLIFGMFVALLYIATNQVSWLVIGALMFTPAVLIAKTLFRHMQQRFDIWLHPFAPQVYNRPYGSSQQLVQGLFGMADGGILGNGWAEGNPILTPLANSDFIYTAIGEELGLVGTTTILLLYLIFIERGFRTALLLNNNFGKLLAAGLAFTIGWQVFVVVGGVTRVIPNTGLTLPFIAAGGSSLISNWIILGILLRLSDAARRPKSQQWLSPDTGELNAIIQNNSESNSPAEPADSPVRPVLPVAGINSYSGKIKASERYGGEK